MDNSQDRAITRGHPGCQNGSLTWSGVPWNALKVLFCLVTNKVSGHPEVVKIAPCIEILAKALPQEVNRRMYVCVWKNAHTLVYSYLYNGDSHFLVIPSYTFIAFYRDNLVK